MDILVWEIYVLGAKIWDKLVPAEILAKNKAEKTNFPQHMGVGHSNMKVTGMPVPTRERKQGAFSTVGFRRKKLGQANQEKRGSLGGISKKLGLFSVNFSK